MRARLPKYAAALCATVALVAGPAALVSTAGSTLLATSAEAEVPLHWYDAGEGLSGA